MIDGSVQNPFGYFGKLPTFGDFIHQVLPQDFANDFHQWLQCSMAASREFMGEDFLPYYLNCPAWKFAASAGICGKQPVVGLTIPSVDRVGRYFNFTLASVLPMDTLPVSYVIANSFGFRELENAAIEILEADYPREDLEAKVSEIAMQFEAVAPCQSQVTQELDHLRLFMGRPSQFADQSAVLLDHLLSAQSGNYSVWWYGQQGQSQSQMIVCEGMPSPEAYMHLLSQGGPIVQQQQETNLIDQIIAGET